MRHGYYIPDQNALRGDRPLALAAQAYYCDVLGLDSKYAARYDGVSIYTRPDGNFAIRVVQQNFFTDQLDVRTHDYPYDPSPPHLLTCGDCGIGKVRMLKATGDDYLLIQKRGCTYQSAIPSHLDIPKCDHCGATYFGQTDYQRVSAAMGADS